MAFRRRFSLKQFIKDRPHIWAALYLLLYLAQFFLIEHISFRNYYVCYLPIDDLIPFCEWFVIPYVLWYPYLTAVGLYLMIQKDGEEFLRFVPFVLGSMTLCLLICVVFPNCQNLRVESFPRDNILTRLVGWLYSADTNTNVLPSMHVLASMASHTMVLKSRYPLFRKKSIRLLSLVSAVLISISTVFIKQHSALDILAAVVLYIPLYFFFYGYDPVGRILRRRREKARNKEIETK